MPERDEESKRNARAKYFRYSHVGLQFFLTVGIFIYGGVELDRFLGTKVLFTLVGLALGFAGGLFFLCREFFPAKRSNEQDKNEN